MKYKCVLPLSEWEFHIQEEEIVELVNCCGKGVTIEQDGNSRNIVIPLDLFQFCFEKC